MQFAYLYSTYSSVRSPLYAIKSQVVHVLKLTKYLIT